MAKTSEIPIPWFHNPDHRPNYDSRALRVRSPKNLRQIFQERPLDKKFLDWVAEQGFKIVHRPDLPEGSGLVSWGPREIWVGGIIWPSPIGNRTLAHELVHIAISPANPEGEGLERIIDEIAEGYANNPLFVEQAKLLLK